MLAARAAGGFVARVARRGSGGGGFPTAAATFVGMGLVEFPFSGTVSVGTLPSGQPFQIYKAGVTVLEPTPGETTIGADFVSGAELNPTPAATGYDARLNGYTPSRTASFPLAMDPGDTLIKSVGAALLGDGPRAGVVAQNGWASLACFASVPANAVGYVAAGWESRGPATLITVGHPAAATLQELLDLIPAFAISGLPPIADVLARFQYAPVLSQTPGTNDLGYQAALPQRFGSATSVGSNYGRQVVVTIDAMAGHLMNSGTSNSDRLKLLALGIVNGGEWYEGPKRVSTAIRPGNGGHFPWTAGLCALYLWAQGRFEEIRTLRTEHGGLLSTMFARTPAVLDLLAPHDDSQKPAQARRRAVTVVDGLNVTFQGFAGGSGNDPSQNNFEGLELVREFDGEFATLVTRVSVSSDKPYVYTIDAQPTPAFAADDVVYMRLPVGVNPPADWMPDENLNGPKTEGRNYVSYIGSGEQAYREIQHTAIQMLFLRALGASATAAFSHEFDYWEDYVVGAETPDFPTAALDHPTTLSGSFRDIADTTNYNWTAGFWTAHSATILAYGNKISGKPDAFPSGSFSAASTVPGQITVTIDLENLPANNGEPITDVVVETITGAGAVTSSTHALAASVTVTRAAGSAVRPAIAGVNSIGTGPRSPYAAELTVAAEAPPLDDITINAFTLAEGDALPVFSGRREMNEGWVFVSGTGELGEAVQGRMVGGAGDSAWVDLKTLGGDIVFCDPTTGAFEGFIAGGARSFTAYTAQVRYTTSTGQTATTANSCYVGWVFSVWGQSGFRSMGTSSNAQIDGVPNITMTHDNRVRFITVNRTSDPGSVVTIDLAGTVGPPRAPVAAMANTLMHFCDDGPIILMTHAVSGSSEKGSLNDSDTQRDWADEVLVTTAGQPHFVDRTRPVVVDVFRHGFETELAYTNELLAISNLGIQMFGVDPDGNPVPRDVFLEPATYNLGANRGWTSNHFQSDMYDWANGARFSSCGQFGVQANTDARNEIADHPVYGPFCVGFPLGYPRISIVKGKPGDAPEDEWTDTGHASNTEPHGANRELAIEAAGIARAVGKTTILFHYNYIKWPTEVEDDKRYVYVGVVGQDVTTLRRELFGDPSGGGDATPGLYGETGGRFTINGEFADTGTTLVTYDGQRRIRLSKPGLVDWNGADVISTDPLSGPGGVSRVHTGAARSSLFEYDQPCAPSPDPVLEAIPIDRWLPAGSTLFSANPLPAPSGLPEPEHVTKLDTVLVAPAGSSTALGNITSDGSPLIIFVSGRGGTSTSSGTCSAATLGGVDIMPNILHNAALQRGRMWMFRVPSPASGTLELAVTPDAASNLQGPVVQVFKEPSGMGTVQGSGAAARAGSTSCPLTGENTATANDTTILAVGAWTNDVTLSSTDTLTQLATGDGGYVQNIGTGGTCTMFGFSGVVNNGATGGTATVSSSTNNAFGYVMWNAPA